MLRDITFTAKPGQTIALVGHTGSGKTSIINLITKFYLPTDGALLMDGIDIRKIASDSLHQQTDHALCDVEVGDGAATQGPHRHDVAGRAPDHLPRLVAHRQHVSRAAVQGDDGRLVEDDASSALVDEGVRRTEVDGQVACRGSVLAFRVVVR